MIGPAPVLPLPCEYPQAEAETQAAVDKVHVVVRLGSPIDVEELGLPPRIPEHEDHQQTGTDRDVGDTGIPLPDRRDRPCGAEYRVDDVVHRVQVQNDEPLTVFPKDSSYPVMKNSRTPRTDKGLLTVA